MRNLARRTIFVLYFALGLARAAWSATPASTAPLGSPNFLPTPEHPVGWRGDWTGHYPGATPPMQWERRAKGITSQLAYQAKKPSGEPGPDAARLENFTIKDWLVAGPFEASDGQSNIEQDFLGGETTVMPNAGDKVGKTAWTFLHVAMDNQTTHIHNGGMCRNLNVDFVYAFGKLSRNAKFEFKFEGDFANKIAYAHTYIHSPNGGKVTLTNLTWGAAAKAWLNGKPLPVVVELNSNVWNKKEIDVDLVKGWNRLLIKVASGESGMEASPDGATSHWRTVAYLTPAGPIAYETKNIAWMTRMTGRSMSAPIVVGDKIFLGSGISDLICINQADGKVLWIRSNTPWDALKPEERAGFKETIQPLAAQLDQANEQIVVAINAQVSPQGMSSDQQALLDKQLKAKFDLESKLHNEFRSIDRKRFPPMQGNEVASSNAVPCSDGSRVYWACGGGMKGVGASVVCCFDLAGKRIWSHHEAFGASEHGLHTSPTVVDGKLIYAANKLLVAFDAATGKVLWKQDTDEYCGESPQVVRIGDEPAILSKQSGRFVNLRRVSDGVKFANFDCNLFGEETPIVENGVVYIPDRMKGWGSDNVAFTALQLPSAVADKAQIKQLFELNWAKDHVQTRGISFWVASPLYVDGIVYVIDMSGGLMAVDVSAQKSDYRRWLDWYARYDRFLYGAVASPTLGGKNIYLIDNAGYTIILKPGRTYQELGRNVLENISPSSISGNPCKQEAFYSSPVFVGHAAYVRGEEYLYAIRVR